MCVCFMVNLRGRALITSLIYRSWTRGDIRLWGVIYEYREGYIPSSCISPGVCECLQVFIHTEFSKVG